MGYAHARNSLVRLGAGAMLAAGLAAGAWLAFPRPRPRTARRAPPPAVDEPVSGSREEAVLAGGCFWGVQGVFQHVKGVTARCRAMPAAKQSTARYERDQPGDTGHAESVTVTFDPRQISYGQSCRSTSRWRTIRPS